MPANILVQPTPRPSVSALERIRADGVLRVGVLYNTPPMSSLSERGQVVGYEADLARAIAEDWGVEAEFVQVTRQTAIDMLLAGEVDVLLAGVVHRREAEADLAFSHTYFASGQMFLVRQDSPIQDLNGVIGRRVGVVQGTASERALGRAMSVEQFTVTPQVYLTLDQAVGALGSGEIDALLANRVELLMAMRTVQEVRLLSEPLEPEPYAVAMRRYDDALRYLVDRSLQRIYAAGKLDEMRRTWFPNVTFSLEIPVWEGVNDDTRGLNDFDAALVYPESSVIDRLLAGEPLRVAGLASEDTPLGGLNLRLDMFYRALVNELAARWGVPVAVAPESTANAAELVAGGQADLGVGVSPNWTGPFEVAYTAPLIRHGDRMMRLVNSPIEGYADLRGGRWVGIFASEPGTADRVNELAESVRTAVNIFTIINDEDAVYSLTVDKNVDVVFGDSLRLIPQVEANPTLVELTDRWYSVEYYTLAVPRRDPDFWALVEVTLQTMAADGTFDALWEQHMAIGDPIGFEQWPGDTDQFQGVRISGE
ncbi:MAG: transporter substrate-binding domain-containing protein [Anaerolineae bacterium]|nr:transporter substrate-binding domain-containing protein [Anaerolineae bacterium]